MPLLADIPEKYRDGFKKIASTDAHTFDNIAEALSSTELAPTIAGLAEKVAKVTQIDSIELTEIFMSAGSLCPFLEKSTVEELVSNVKGIARNKSYISSEHIEVLGERLELLLKSDKLYYAAKTYSLLSQYGNIFLQARVVTDIRPVFGVDVTKEPQGALIIHNLHIHYRADEESEHKDIYLALDSNDIKLLKDALSRAEKKEENLASLLKKVPLQNLND